MKTIMQKAYNFDNNTKIRYSIIEGELCPAGYPKGHEGTDWFYLTNNGQVVFDDMNLQDARELCNALNDGMKISDYFAKSTYRPYRSMGHHIFGDKWRDV